MTTPFNAFAADYYHRGWHPVPLWAGDADIPEHLRAAHKHNPLPGFTGRAGRNADLSEIEGWRQAGMWIPQRGRLWPCFNFASRMPDEVIALDVDAYAGGLDLLGALEKKHGKLPPTYISTARTDGSGHRYYRVDGRRVWRDPHKGHEGIQVLHWGWRYAVVPPSLHPKTGTHYVWCAPDGALSWHPPGVGELPLLPQAWASSLDTGADPDERAPRVKCDTAAALQRVEDWDIDGEPCRHMRQVLDDLPTPGRGSRHPVVIPKQMSLLRWGHCFHPGLREAIDELETWFIQALGGDRDHTSEWQAGLTGAVAAILAKPSPDIQRTGCPVVVNFSTPSLAAFAAQPHGPLYGGTQ